MVGLPKIMGSIDSDVDTGQPQMYNDFSSPTDPSPLQLSSPVQGLRSLKVRGEEDPSTLMKVCEQASYVTEEFLDTVTNSKNRPIGQGVLVLLLRMRYREEIFTKQVRKQLENMEKYRPYFSVWVTSVQAVIFIMAITIYGITDFGFGEAVDLKKENLVLLGAKYGPCMKLDKEMLVQNQLSFQKEDTSGCCIRKDGDGCYQSPEELCDKTLLTTFKKWSLRYPGPNRRISGPVCGQDPRYCDDSSLTKSFDAWPDNILTWPVCAKRKTMNRTEDDPHMWCSLLARPCCFGLKGQCIMTSWEHCDFLEGSYYVDAYLCSQVNCLQDSCGMTTFLRDQEPDQFYRLWTSLFLHKGWIQLAVTVLFQLTLMCDLEHMAGSVNVGIIYILSGIMGYLGSGIAVPRNVEVGPMPSQMGIIAAIMIEFMQNQPMYTHPGRPFKVFGLFLLVVFSLGLLPLYDNWANLFGLVGGFEISFVLLPYITFSDSTATAKRLSIAVCALTSALLLFLLIFFFYLAPLESCDWCPYLTCIPFTDTFCPSVRTNDTYDVYSAMVLD